MIPWMMQQQLYNQCNVFSLLLLLKKIFCIKRQFMRQFCNTEMSLSGLQSFKIRSEILLTDWVFMDHSGGRSV